MVVTAVSAVRPLSGSKEKPVLLLPKGLLAVAEVISTPNPETQNPKPVQCTAS